MHKDSKLMEQMIINAGRQLGKSIDVMILDELFSSRDKFSIVKSWTTRKGVKMYKLDVGHEVYDWLKTNYDQFSKSDPQWWIVRGEINITEKMFTLVALKFNLDQSNEVQSNQN